MGTFRLKILDGLDEVVAFTMPQFIEENLQCFLSIYGSMKSPSAWAAHYVIYYPLYLSCHFTLIYLLFHKEVMLRKYLMRGLLSIIILLILGKVIFGIINLQIMEEYFSFAFHKLIALPFLLLAIEGGRFLYVLIEEKFSEDTLNNE